MKINPKPSEKASPPLENKGGMGLDSPCKGGSNGGQSPKGK